MKNDLGFRFSYDKYMGRFTLDYFLKTARELENLVRASRSQVDSEIFTCEDRYTYDWSTVSTITEESTKALEQRKEYTLDEMTQEIWDKAHRLSFRIKDESPTFCIWLTYDKTAEKKRLQFYGQCMDKQTHKNIMEGFHKRGFSYRLGDGYSKTSDFMLALTKKNLGIK